MGPPYIKQRRRDRLDPKLAELWDVIRKGHSVNADINYCFFKLLVTLRARYGDDKYLVLSYIHAIPVDVANEFQRRFFDPYEDKKIVENGEVTPL